MRALADVHGQIADALEVGDHLERERDEAQVGRHGLPLGQDDQTQLVGLDLDLVDLVVVLDGAPREDRRRARPAALTALAIMASTWPAISRSLSRTCRSWLSYSRSVWARVMTSSRISRTEYYYWRRARSECCMADQPNFPVM